jgi:hypothetical protein
VKYDRNASQADRAARRGNDLPAAHGGANHDLRDALDVAEVGPPDGRAGLP